MHTFWGGFFSKLFDIFGMCFIAGRPVEGRTLGETVQAHKDDTDAERFTDDRQPLHEVRWGCPVCYQANFDFTLP